jgi:DNA-binding transcriptional LysR family regulator
MPAKKGKNVVLNIESLKYFYMIAKAGNISSVAKEVHLTQSALSQQIQKLESDFNKSLLIRSNKGVQLTQEGKIVYKFADNILRTYQHMMEEIESESKKNIVIKIEAPSSLADYALPCTMIKANDKYHSHKYELTSNTSYEIMQNVSNNICDVGFSYIGNVRGHSGVLSHRAGANKIILVARNNADAPDSLTPEQLGKVCIITLTGKNDINEIIFSKLEKLGISKKTLDCNLSVEGIVGAKMMILRGYGMAFLPYISVKEELYKKQFKEISISGLDMNLDIFLLYKKIHTEHVNDFLEWFEKNGEASFC